VAEQSEHALGFADCGLEVTRVALGNFLKPKIMAVPDYFE
jgi:hypothetical protein